MHKDGLSTVIYVKTWAVRAFKVNLLASAFSFLGFCFTVSMRFTYLRNNSPVHNHPSGWVPLCSQKKIEFHPGCGTTTPDVEMSSDHRVSGIAPRERGGWRSTGGAGEILSVPPGVEEVAWGMGVCISLLRSLL